MKDLLVFQIYDDLSEKVIHTFTGASFEHGMSEFKRFLKSVEKYSEPNNFYLFYLGALSVCESFADCQSWIANHGEDVFTSDDFDKVDLDESKS